MEWECSPVASIGYPNLSPLDKFVLGSTILGSHIHLPLWALSRVLTRGQHTTLLARHLARRSTHITDNSSGGWCLEFVGSYLPLRPPGGAVQGSQLSASSGRWLENGGGSPMTCTFRMPPCPWVLLFGTAGSAATAPPGKALTAALPAAGTPALSLSIFVEAPHGSRNSAPGIWA